jgi:cell division protein FtsL
MQPKIPSEWLELPRDERRKKIKQLNQKRKKSTALIKKLLWFLMLVVSVSILFYVLSSKQTKLSNQQTQEVKLDTALENVTLDGLVEEYMAEGAKHVGLKTAVDFKTNPPTSGSHLANPQPWGYYNKVLADKAVVHALEHGGIWISYQSLSDGDKLILKEIAKVNPLSVIVSSRPANDNKIVVASWSRMMKLDSIDSALIQKYINTYKNQSPEKLAL